MLIKTQFIDLLVWVDTLNLRLYTRICNQISNIKSIQVCQQWMQFYTRPESHSCWANELDVKKKITSWRSTTFMGTHPFFQIPNSNKILQHLIYGNRRCDLFLSEKRIIPTWKNITLPLYDHKDVCGLTVFTLCSSNCYPDMHFLLLLLLFHLSWSSQRARGSSAKFTC